jgi:hypothetical protein
MATFLHHLSSRPGHFDNSPEKRSFFVRVNVATGRAEVPVVGENDPPGFGEHHLSCNFKLGPGSGHARGRNKTGRFDNRREKQKRDDCMRRPVTKPGRGLMISGNS